MNKTKLLYLENMQQYEGESEVLGILEEDGKTAIVLDGTIFYPQGGGQPYDLGKIVGDTGEFLVKEVRNMDGLVKHYGEFTQGDLAIGQRVKMLVDADRRLLHSKLHTAGHVVDSALVKMGLKWGDSRGHHFPDGPYVTYQNLTGIDDDLKQKIEDQVNALINQGYAVETLEIAPAEMSVHCFPGNMNYPEGIERIRIVKVYGELGCPCGGTHLANIKEIGAIKIPKLKNEKDWVRVRYDLA